MALFDTDFDSKLATVVTEAKEAKECKEDEKECKECEDKKEEKKEEKAAEEVKDEKEEKAEDKADEAEEKEEEEDEEELELDEDDANEAEESATFDVEEATSFEDMKGSKIALATMVQESHTACLEFIGTCIALDKVDVKCTESLAKATTASEKEIITEQFKESVKVYVQKFKAFIQKVINTIKRGVSRVGAYLERLMLKAQAKWATRNVKTVDPSAYKDLKFTAPKAVCKDDLSALAVNAVGYVADDVKKLAKVAMEVNDEASAEKAKAEIMEAELPKAMDIITAICGQVEECTGADFGSRNLLNDIKNAKPGKTLANATNSVVAQIKAVERSIAQSKDIDSKAMTVKVAAVNKIVGWMNRVFAAVNQIGVFWVRVRMVALNAAVKGVKEEPAKAEPAKENLSLIEQFEAMM